jgi:hypothetical protein
LGEEACTVTPTATASAKTVAIRRVRMRRAP